MVAAWSFFACFNSACMLAETHPKFRTKQPDTGDDIPRSAFAAAGSKAKDQTSQNGSAAALTNGVGLAPAQSAPLEATPERQIYRSMTSARSELGKLSNLVVPNYGYMVV